MQGAVLVAIAAAIGNLLQGWDNATIAGAVLYIKQEFKLETNPTMEGLIVATSLIGATIVTTFSGGVSDLIGRRPMLISSSLLYSISGILMLWSPNVYVLLLARFICGLGIGLAVTLIPLYISETAPSDIRGLLNTLPQFTGSAGMFLSYMMIFGMSLMANPNWRLMLSVLSIPSLFYLLVAIMYLPESPRWLVSKGRMLEAKQVLQKLRGMEDVSGEMALLVEGLEVGGEASIEEYIIGPGNDLNEKTGTDTDKDQVTLYGPEEGLSWIARPAPGQSLIGLASRHGSTEYQKSSMPLMDPLVTLFGSIHENLPETGSMCGSMRSTLFPNFGSMFSAAGHPKTDQWDLESGHHEGDGYSSDHSVGADSDDDMNAPLLSRQTTSMEGKEMANHATQGSVFSIRHHSSLFHGNARETASGTGIGGGWQLAWKRTEREGPDGKKEGGFKRIYLHEGIPQSRRGSLVSLPGNEMAPEGEFIQASALVSESALFPKESVGQRPVGPAMVHPSGAAVEGSKWGDLFEPGVKRALQVGIGIQILQQFAGINGVMYYTPQILKQAGVEVLLANLGLSSDSASILISGFTTFMMLPCIGVAMRLMDNAGRRTLLLTTIPILIMSLVVLVISNVVSMGAVLHAILSTASVIIYFCCFVTGFGPIPNILCSEIFPTRVRGLCIAICALTYWICDIIVTYSLPVLLTSIGLAGVFGIYAAICVISLVFVYLKVPETKGMPLEVISEFFSVGSREP